ncbi:MAG: hypothetical protein RI947_164 [Candidatus Parcubacteria bacterium]
MRRVLIDAAALILVLVLALVVIVLNQQTGPHTTAGVILNGSTATIPAGETLVLQTSDLKYYASIVREGSEVVVIGMFSARYPQRLCGRGCPIQVNVVSLYNVTVTELDDNALKVEWSWPVKLR